MRLAKIIIVIVLLLIILIFTFGSIIPTLTGTFADIKNRPEVNIWKLVFSIVQLLIAIYFITKGVKFIFKSSKKVK